MQNENVIGEAVKFDRSKFDEETDKVRWQIGPHHEHVVKRYDQKKAMCSRNKA